MNWSYTQQYENRNTEQQQTSIYYILCASDAAGDDRGTALSVITGFGSAADWMRA